VVATSGIAVFDLIEKSNPVTTATKAPKEPPPHRKRGKIFSERKRRRPFLPHAPDERRTEAEDQKVPANR
jgi:hypothetical protein